MLLPKGVVEVNTLRDLRSGFHGKVVLSGGSFDSAAAFAQGQYAWGKNVFGASGGMTSHYLNPVVIQNYTNRGTLGDFSTNYQRDLTPKDRLSLSVRQNVVNAIDFGGLFSGNAIGPSRSVSLRLTTNF